MKKSKFLTLLLASTTTITLLAGCAGGGNSPVNSSPAASSSSGSPSSGVTDTPTAGGYEEPYSYTFYFNNDWETLRLWGEDATSQYMQEKFNIDIEFMRADTDYQTKFNIMVASEDLPDAISLGRDTNLYKMVDLGMLQSLNPLRENSPYYDESITESTRELLVVKGDLYTIPNWAKKDKATGGNSVWMYNKRLYEEAGSPDLSTFEGMYAYAKYVKDNIPTNKEGLATIPFSTGETRDGEKLFSGFYRSFGGANTAASWYVASDGVIKSIFNDGLAREVMLELNKWYREGLISETIFPDTPEQMLEKLVSGRIALLYYDQSQDDANHFRQILKESFSGDDYVVLDPVYPPAKGLDASDIYYEGQSPVDGGGVHITTAAENPQRIFDFHSWLMTKEGSVTQMYGPEGQLWSEKDADGNPIMERYDTTLTSEEKNKLGLWFWMIPGHGENVDFTKFAVNDAAPEDQKSWVVSNQSDILTPHLVLTSEYFGFNDTIDPLSDLGIKRTLCEDKIKEFLPKIIVAGSEAEAQKMIDEVVKFLAENGMPDIEATFDAKFQENCEIQGGSKYAK